MTPAEKRDATLRTVQLPDCCGNCQHYCIDMKVCWLLPLATDTINPELNQLCDLHARKPDGGNG